MLVAFVWGLIRELTDQTVKNIDFITDNLGLVNLGFVNYVQKMNDMDEAIEKAKQETDEDPVNLDSLGYPQRSRRRI